MGWWLGLRAFQRVDKQLDFAFLKSCERNFAKIVEILDHQMVERSSKQSSDPAYYIRDWLIFKSATYFLSPAHNSKELGGTKATCNFQREMIAMVSFSSCQRNFIKIGSKLSSIKMNLWSHRFFQLTTQKFEGFLP